MKTPVFTGEFTADAMGGERAGNSVGTVAGRRQCRGCTVEGGTKQARSRPEPNAKVEGTVEAGAWASVKIGVEAGRHAPRK